jgi:molybdopterin-biosynthesis enzyme MoeA-like protein
VASSRSKSMKQVWRNTAADEPHNTLAVTESLRGGIGSPSDDLTTAAAAVTA